MVGLKSAHPYRFWDLLVCGSTAVLQVSSSRGGEGPLRSTLSVLLLLRTWRRRGPLLSSPRLLCRLPFNRRYTQLGLPVRSNGKVCLRRWWWVVLFVSPPSGLLLGISIVDNFLLSIFDNDIVNTLSNCYLIRYSMSIEKKKNTQI